MYDREKASAIIQKISDARKRGKSPKINHAEALIIEQYLNEQHWCRSIGTKYLNRTKG